MMILFSAARCRQVYLCSSLINCTKADELRYRDRRLQLQVEEVLGDVPDVGDVFLNDEPNGIEEGRIATDA